MYISTNWLHVHLAALDCLRDWRMKRSSTARCSSPQYSSDENGEYEGPSIKRSNPTRAKSGAAKCLTTFQVEWSKEWPCITKGSTAHHYWCSICRVERSCGHQKDIERPIGSDKQVKKVEAVRSSGKIQKFSMWHQVLTK